MHFTNLKKCEKLYSVNPNAMVANSPQTAQEQVARNAEAIPDDVLDMADAALSDFANSVRAGATPQLDYINDLLESAEREA